MNKNIDLNVFGGKFVEFIKRDSTCPWFKDIKPYIYASIKNQVLLNYWNVGFFGNLSTTLWCIAYLYKIKKIPSRVDFSKTFDLFKTNEQTVKQIDIYPLLFKIVPKTIKLRNYFFMHHHILYAEYDLRNLWSLALKYFTLSDSLLELERKLRDKYSIDLHNTLGVWVRGTDKILEIKNASPDSYCRKIDEILKKKPNLRIWIQTDQKQYQDYFLARYPHNSFVIDELPVTESSTGIHLDKSFTFDKFQFGRYLLAAVHLMSQCNTVVTHTGNVGYWLALYRGNLKNFYQDTTDFFKNNILETRLRFNCTPITYKIYTIRRILIGNVRALLRKLFKLIDLNNEY